MLTPIPGLTPFATKGNAMMDDGKFDIDVGAAQMGANRHAGL